MAPFYQQPTKTYRIENQAHAAKDSQSKQQSSGRANNTHTTNQGRRETFVVLLLSTQAHSVLSHSAINPCLEIVGQRVADENLVLQNRRHFLLALPQAQPSLEMGRLDAANEGSEVCDALVGGHVLVVAGPGEHNDVGGERSRSRKS